MLYTNMVLLVSQHFFLDNFLLESEHFLTNLIFKSIQNMIGICSIKLFSH